MGEDKTAKWKRRGVFHMESTEDLGCFTGVHRVIHRCVIHQMKDQG